MFTSAILPAPCSGAFSWTACCAPCRTQAPAGLPVQLNAPLLSALDPSCAVPKIPFKKSCDKKHLTKKSVGYASNVLFTNVHSKRL